MKKIFTILLSLSASIVAISAEAMIANELRNNADVPHQVEQYRMLINRYALSDYSNAAQYNLLQAILSNMGGDRSKQVRLLWVNKEAYKSAVEIRKVLLNLGIESQRIQIIANPNKVALYPLYADVEQIGVKAAYCPGKTIDNMLSKDGNCAVKSNSRVQLKF
ncbi:hypothetical protein [Rodentibacter sp. Ppn85]|uniref:hypothetical protein n=1 Tax=Rodentibacter sp. Ppn85 TaxID=1908525 RepID=UPI000986742D|nr:hypothetical protein [Rodentibacter sp. Ppn85]OOF61141.1 hypothetical protein BKL51_10915 [Rodentibacter sp. Ppn85]